MANAFRMDEEGSRALTTRLVVQRIKRRQQALRRKWCQLSREELATELLAIGRALLDAAPLFLPRAFGSHGVRGRQNGTDPSLNGQLGGFLRFAAAAYQDRQGFPGNGQHKEPDAWWDEQPEDQWRELVFWSQRALDDLEDLIRWLQGNRPEAEAGQ